MGNGDILGNTLESIEATGNRHYQPGGLIETPGNDGGDLETATLIEENRESHYNQVNQHSTKKR